MKHISLAQNPGYTLAYTDASTFNFTLASFF